MSNATLRHLGFRASFVIGASSFVILATLCHSTLASRHCSLPAGCRTLARSAFICAICVQASLRFGASVATLLEEALLDLPELFFDARVNHAAVGLNQATAAGDQRILDKLDAVVP